jgi:hypothetical protein
MTFSQIPSVWGNIRTLDLGIMRLVYDHCATGAQPSEKGKFLTFSLSPLSVSGRIQTLDLRNMRLLYYVLLTHNQVRQEYFPLAAVPVARYEPLIPGL